VRRSSGTIPDVIRPTFTPTAEQRDAIDRAKRLALLVSDAEANMWAAIREARELGVPDVKLCNETGQSRATLNRKFGPRADQSRGA
jgi:hypothetical protein